MQTEVSTPRSAVEAVTQVLERMPDGVVVFDGRHDVVWSNRVATTLLSDVSLQAPALLQELAPGEVTELELGSHRLVEARAVTIDWDGAPASLVMLRDITERIRAQASILVATEELRSANARLQMLADVDPLTGLLNRRGLERLLETEMLPKARMGWDLVAIMVDCDGFKVV